MSDIENESMISMHTIVGEIQVGGPGLNNNMKKSFLTSRHHSRMGISSMNSASLYSERPPSPASVRNEFVPRFGVQRPTQSVISRSRSPYSVRSVQTSASSMSVIDITKVISHEQFSTHELQLIKDFVDGQLKRRHKSKNIRRRYKNGRTISSVSQVNRNIHSDSSNSSVASEGDLSCGNISSINPINRLPQFSIDPVIDSAPTTKENVFSIPKRVDNLHSANEMPKNAPKQTNGVVTLKERLAKGFPSLSERFNKTTLSSNACTATSSVNKQASTTNRNVNNHSSEDEGIFSESQFRPGFNSTVQQKQSVVVSITGHSENAHEKENLIKDNGMFKKPPLPKSKGKSNSDPKQTQKPTALEPIIENKQVIQDTELLDNNISTKPSFTKRKLFTQKLDMIGSKSDSAGPSPHSKLDKEKTKARKLVSTQSCLNRSVSDEENNVMDLIHKIVPADQINLTKKSNKTSNPQDGESDISDTFTDETLNETVFDIKEKEEATKRSKKVNLTACKVRLESIDTATHKNGEVKTVFQKCKSPKSFWDTDIESEMESENIPTWKIVRPLKEKDPVVEAVKTSSNKNEKLPIKRNKRNIESNNSPRKRVKLSSEDSGNIKNSLQENIISNGTRSKSNTCIKQLPRDTKTTVDNKRSRSLNRQKNCSSCDLRVDSAKENKTNSKTPVNKANQNLDNKNKTPIEINKTAVKLKQTLIKDTLKDKKIPEKVKVTQENTKDNNNVIVKNTKLSKNILKDTEINKKNLTKNSKDVKTAKKTAKEIASPERTLKKAKTTNPFLDSFDDSLNISNKSLRSRNNTRKDNSLVNADFNISTNSLRPRKKGTKIK